MQRLTWLRTLKLARLVVVLGAAVTPAHADTLEAIRQREVLVWGADAEGGGPYVYPRDDDPTQVQGFEVELATVLAAKLGAQAQFAQGQWEKLPDLLNPNFF